MIAALLAAAWAREPAEPSPPAPPPADVVLGQGRVAVVELPGPPSQLSVGSTRTLTVTASPPYLLLLGGAPGRTSATIEAGALAHKWTVEVSADRSVAPTGAGLTPIPTHQVGLALDAGALLALDDTNTGFTVGADKVASARLFANDHLWIQGMEEGVTDVLLERAEQPPLRLTVTVGKAAPLPAGFVAPTQRDTVVVGGELMLPLPEGAGALLVGHTSRVRAEPSPDYRVLAVTGKRPGLTTLLVRHPEGVWMREVQVTAPPE